MNANDLFTLVVGGGFLWLCCAAEPQQGPNVCERAEGKSWNSDTVFAKTACDVVIPVTVTTGKAVADFFDPPKDQRLRD